MPSTLNKEQVIELTEKLRKAKAIYFTDYLGLDVSSITKLRKEFFDQEVEFLVAKNTLIKLAAENNKITGLEEFLSGPTALAISYDEPVKPARVIKKFAKMHIKPDVKGILFEGFTSKQGRAAVTFCWDHSKSTNWFSKNFKCIHVKYGVCIDKLKKFKKQLNKFVKE